MRMKPAGASRASQGGHGFTQDVALFAGVKDDVIAGGLDVVNLLGLEEQNAFRGLNQDASTARGGDVQVGEQPASWASRRRPGALTTCSRAR